MTDATTNDSLPLTALAYPIEAIPAATGIKRDKLFAAVRDGRLTARKSGRNTIVEADELRRYIKSLPSKGRPPDDQATAVEQRISEAA
jgi:hypothetical protein